MGFDWEDILDAEGEDLQRAYDDNIQDAYDYYDERQDYDEDDNY